MLNANENLIRISQKIQWNVNYTLFIIKVRLIKCNIYIFKPNAFLFKVTIWMLAAAWQNYLRMLNQKSYYCNIFLLYRAMPDVIKDDWQEGKDKDFIQFLGKQAVILMPFWLLVIFIISVHLYRKGINIINTGRLQKSVIWKSGTFWFINQLSNDFQQINLITCTSLIHLGYFEYKTFSDNQV